MISVMITHDGAKSKHEWWLNFVEYCFPHPRTPGSTQDHVDTANVELMNWSAQIWVTDNVGICLDFYDEHAYHWFVLRWS